VIKLLKVFFFKEAELFMSYAIGFTVYYMCCFIIELFFRMLLCNQPEFNVYISVDG